jgi:AAA+ ATPase superfamily predicted ATPase
MSKRTTKFKNPYDLSAMMAAKATTPALGEMPTASSKSQMPVQLPERVMREVKENAELGKSLWKELDDVLKNKNTVTVAEFTKYAPLYKKSVADTGLSLEQFERLSIEFKQRFDIYSSIRIVDNGGAVITEIHPIFRQITAISQDKNKSHLRFHQDGSDKLEIYSKTAKDTLLVSILQEQDFKTVPQERVNAVKSVIDLTTKSRGPITKLTINGRPITPNNEEVIPTKIGVSVNSLLDETDAEPD